MTEGSFGKLATMASSLSNEFAKEALPQALPNWQGMPMAESKPPAGLRGIRKARGMTIEQLAEKTDLSVGYLSRVERGERELGNQARRDVAAVLQCSEEQLRFEGPPVVAEQPGGLGKSRWSRAANGHDTARTIPVYGNITGGVSDEIYFGQEIRQVPCPDRLLAVPEAFALEVRGDSMEPRYFAGELVYANPRKAHSRNSFVAIERHDGTGIVKQYIEREGDKVRLRQFNPGKELAVPVKDIKRIVRIVGSGEE